MENIKDQDLLDEIRFDIKVKDLRKAQLVLAALEHVNRETQKEALFEVAQAEESFSIRLLTGVFVNTPDIARSFPHLKETMYSKILGYPEVLLDLLSNEQDPLTKIFLAKVAGEICLEAAVPIQLDLLTRESDPKTLESIIISLGMIGSPDSAGPISEFLHAPDRELVLAAVRALGELATPKAMQRLFDRLGEDPDLDQEIINIFSKAQTPEALEKLNDTLISQHAHIRTAGKQKLGEIGVMSVRILIKNLLKVDPDLVIHSLNVLGDIGDPLAIPAIRKLLHNNPENANIRFAAYETLGRLPVDQGAFALAAGLEDPAANVRNAAAKAIDRNYNAVLAGGIRNMTCSGDDEALRIMETIINSQCDNIFLDLLEEGFFKPAAIAYLSKNAHPEIRSYYSEVLTSKGYDDIAKQIALSKAVKVKAVLRVYAVDDSRMILHIYRTVLHNLGCESMLFEFPAKALENVRKDNPDVILTDLNMPDITGIDLTAGVRKLFTNEEMPIIMVTTQDEAKDNQSAYNAGVNGILQKPFTESRIRGALKKFAGLTLD